MALIEITLTGSEGERPEFRDIVEFLWDFNLLYEASRLATDGRYEGFRFSPYIYTRNGRPLRREDRLTLLTLAHESPIKLRTVVALTGGAAASLWVLVQTAHMVDQWHLEDRKLAAEVVKIESEARKNDSETRKNELEARKTELEIDQLEHEQQERAKASASPSPASGEEVEGGDTPPVLFLPIARRDQSLRIFEQRVERREASDEIYSIINRFTKSPVKLEDVEVRLVTDDE